MEFLIQYKDYNQEEERKEKKKVTTIHNKSDLQYMYCLLLVWHV